MSDLNKHEKNEVKVCGKEVTFYVATQQRNCVCRLFASHYNEAANNHCGWTILHQKLCHAALASKLLLNN